MEYNKNRYWQCSYSRQHLSFINIYTATDITGIAWLQQSRQEHYTTV